MGDGQNNTNASAKQVPAAGPHVGNGLTISALDGSMVTLTGDVLTAPGRVLQIAPQHFDLYAYVSDGTLLVAAGRRFDAHVQTFGLKLREKNHQIRQTLEVEISTLKKVYSFASETSTGKNAKASQPAELDVKMRRDLVELIGRAAAVGASDIHISANNSGAMVEMRINGMLTRIGQMEEEYARSMMAAAFAMATESDPTYIQSTFQNGSIIDNGTLGLPKKVQSLRLQWNPTMLGGRYAVMRLHYTTNDATTGIDKLGFAPHHLAIFEELRRRPTGIIIVSGPTGSGKSTTLQKCLTTLLREKQHRNLITVEDPPEYRIPGAKQMQVVNATKADERAAKFVEAIVASLRSDPDTIMIGEIRDLESARLAIAAAYTGHSVWTSLHANNAIAIVGRLLDLGLEAWKATDHETITGLVAQRLLPKVCQHCRVPADKAVEHGFIHKSVLERLRGVMTKAGITGNFPIHTHRPNGCPKCHGQGINGRTVAAEIIAPDETFMSYCREHRKNDARAHWIREHGGITMMAHAITKVLSGEVSPEAVEEIVDTITWDDSMPRIKEILKP